MSGRRWKRGKHPKKKTHISPTPSLITRLLPIPDPDIVPSPNQQIPPGIRTTRLHPTATSLGHSACLILCRISGIGTFGHGIEIQLLHAGQIAAQGEGVEEAVGGRLEDVVGHSVG